MAIKKTVKRNGNFSRIILFADDEEIKKAKDKLTKILKSKNISMYDLALDIGISYTPIRNIIKEEKATQKTIDVVNKFLERL